MLSIKSFIVDKFLSVWWAVVILLLALPFCGVGRELFFIHRLSYCLPAVLAVMKCVQ